MQLLKSTVGRKILMAITGQLMVLFVIVHMIGNTTIFGWIHGGINAYAEHLHALPALVWIFRLCMLAFVTVHVFFGIQLSLENSAATPGSYAVKNHLKATFSSINMIWTGLLILAFVVYHLLHFTARVTPGVVLGVDAQGRFDVFTMVITSFQNGGIFFIYCAAMVALFLHLFHGVSSFFQTMGWNTACTQDGVSTLGKVVAIVLFVGYVTIPLTIITHILR